MKHLPAWLGVSSCFLGLATGAPSAAFAGAEAGQAPLPAEADGALEGRYLAGLRDRVEPRWTKSFLKMAAERLPATDPLNDPARSATLEVVLDAEGRVSELRFDGRSGVAGFDAAAEEILREASPFPAPPLELRSDDDRLHLRWTFARDGRGARGLEVLQKESPLEVALPRLLAAGRDEEALRRVRAAAEPQEALTLFARSWLARHQGRPAKAADAGAVDGAAALLAAGDRRGEEVVKAALTRKEHAALAARALVTARIPVCPLVKAALGDARHAAHEAALEALRAGAEADCVPGLVAVATDARAPVARRVTAIAALGTSGEIEARKALLGLGDDKDTRLRAAALGAWARPGGGKPVLFRLAPLLKDKAVEIRAAAGAGVVRAAGDEGVAQLYLLTKETSPSPYEAVAVELGRLASEPSAQLIARLLRKEDVRVRRAAAAALALRTDEAAMRLLASVAKDAAPEVRAFALGLLGPEERARLVEAPPSADTYEAWLKGPQRAAGAGWVLARLDRATPEERLRLCAAWLWAGEAPRAVASH